MEKIFGAEVLGRMKEWVWKWQRLSAISYVIYEIKQYISIIYIALINLLNMTSQQLLTQITEVYFDADLPPMSVLLIRHSRANQSGRYRCVRRCREVNGTHLVEEENASILLDIMSSARRSVSSRRISTVIGRFVLCLLKPVLSLNYLFLI